MSNAIPEILRAAQLLFRPGSVVEVRVPKAGRLGTVAGYFDDFEAMAREVQKLEFAKHPGVYWTINALDPALLQRGVNRIRTHVGQGDLTSDKDILHRYYLPVDHDPVRPSGISATDAQHEAGLAHALQVQGALSAEGWPEAIYADSGNGAHSIYAIDLPNDPESKSLLSRVLQGLAARFDTLDAEVPVGIDQTMFNASRIIKIYGTTARKGDASEERPHRLSRLLRVPQQIVPVSLELLQAVAVKAAAGKPAPAPRSESYRGSRSGREFNLEEFLGRHGIRYRTKLPYQGGWKYQLEQCPWDASHGYPDACVFHFPDGYAFRCLHNSCRDHDWRAFRELFDGPRPQRTYRAPLALPEPLDEDVPPATEREEDAEPQALTLEDVEAAVDLAIEKQSSAEVMRLAPAIAALRPQHQAVIAAKLRDGFKDEWKALEKWFDKALRDATAELAKNGTGQKPPAEPPAGEGGGDEGKPDLVDFPLTDSGNGQRIVALFGRDIRYCNEMETWFVWDGKRWAADRSNLMRQKANEMARLLYLQALRLPDGERRRLLSKHALASESSRGISNALTEAARMPGIPVSAHALDQYPDHLNCRNGTVHLRDGSIAPHKREMLLTKLCDHNYRPDAKCPLFQIFVEWTMGGPEDGNPDAELPEVTVRLVAFLQRVIGYSITGQVGEKAVFVFYGEGGNNGKTTLLTIFRQLLGRDYASLLLIDTIMHARSTDNTAREDMADLRGARFVQTSEIGKEDRLNAQRVKFLTQGMGTIKSRRLHEHLIEFVATHKLLMDCNYRPKVTEQDDGTWRRLIQLPFSYTISEDRKDLNFLEKLKPEAEGMLAWAVRGAIEWYKHGLGKPPEVVEAGQDWREHDDPLREFLSDWCDLGPELICPVSDLMPAYLLWAKEYGEKFPLTRRGFNELLTGKGIKQAKQRADLSYYGEDSREPTRIWIGVQLKITAVQKLRGDRAPDYRQSRISDQNF